MPSMRKGAAGGLVYSTEDGHMCQVCRQPVSACTCRAATQAVPAGDGPGRCFCFRSIACKRRHFCGDGISDTDLGEECDLGEKNDLKLDANLQPAPDDPKAQVVCRKNCTVPPGIIF